MDVLHQAASGSPCVSCHFTVAILQHLCHFHEFTEPACEGRIRLTDIETILFDKHPPFVSGREAFSACDRHGSSPA